MDALWLSPIYPSPDKDFGYDVSDYIDIDPRFGSLADFDLLLSEAHRAAFVSFLTWCSTTPLTSMHGFWNRVPAATIPKRIGTSGSPLDSPIFRHRWWEQGGPPNNWQSIFGGRAWTYASERDQYYYHMFVPEQPDVNWRNPEVRQAMLDVVRFWLDRGVDGFRLDVFNMYFKDEHLRNNPFKPGLRSFDRQQHIYDCDQPEMLPLLQELRGILDSYPERYAVGETFFPTQEKMIRYSGKDKLHAAFNFDFMWSRFDPAKLITSILDWEALYAKHELWPNYVLGNHDAPRMASRHAKDKRDARIKVMMALQLTLRGTPFLYYGEEIGMRDISLKHSEILDPPGKKYWPFYKGRDGCRSPMQWNDSSYAGFSIREALAASASQFPNTQRRGPAGRSGFHAEFHARAYQTAPGKICLATGRFQGIDCTTQRCVSLPASDTRTNHPDCVELQRPHSDSRRHARREMGSAVLNC